MRVLELPGGGVGSTTMGVDSIPLNCTVKMNASGKRTGAEDWYKLSSLRLERRGF